MNTNKKTSIISTGFKELDNTINGGFNKGEVIILGARPAMGKTSLALNIVQNVCLNMNKGVAVFSLELTKERLIQRMMSLSSEIDNDKFKEGDLNAQDWAKLSNTMKQYVNSDVYIDDTVGQSIEEIFEKCRELKLKEKNLSLIIIDYLQLIKIGALKCTLQFCGTAKIKYWCIEKHSTILSHWQDAEINST